MNQITTNAIVLARINFGEADKIITVITSDYGKVRLLARGVRKIKSKLAGGIELFCVTTFTLIKGKGDIDTLTSSRLQTHYGNITTDYSRTMIGYDFLKIINSKTQDNCDQDYYRLLLVSLRSLDDVNINAELVKCWFTINLLKLMGHIPDFKFDKNGSKLEPGDSYGFDYQEVGFVKQAKGRYGVNHIKIMRLLLQEPPEKLQIIKDLPKYLPEIDVLLTNALKNV